jgi:hypothetical protein
VDAGAFARYTCAMARGTKRSGPRFTVPETWRPILKRNERQGAGLFDVLACGHAVAASDTAHRRFRSCPDCRVLVQQYADQVGRESRAA